MLIILVTLAGRSGSCILCSYNILPEFCSIKIAEPASNFKEFVFSEVEAVVGKASRALLAFDHT